MGKGAQMTLFSTLSTIILKNSRDGDSTMSQGRLLQWLIFLTVKNFHSISRWSISQCNLYALPLVPSVWLFVKRLHHLHSQPLSTGKLWWGSLWIFSSPCRKDINTTFFHLRTGSLALWSSLWLSFGHSPVY